MTVKAVKMTPKQQTMHEICELLDAQAKKEGMGLDREMFSKKHMRLTHEVLLSALANMKRDA